jgi:Na+-translocating ferredoxin:NAD+ oxidoreductase RnfG subunit
MQTTRNMKLLIVILAALAAISALLLHHESHIAHQSRQANIAAQLQHDQDQIRKDDAEYEEEELFQKQVEALKKKTHAYAGNESKTWNSSKP